MFRRSEVYYCEDRTTGQQKSLRTRDEAEAQRIIQAKNDAVKLPQMNLAMAKTYLSAQDPKMITRTWADVFARFSDRSNDNTRNQGTESQFEETTIDRLCALGYRYQYGGDIERDWRDVVMVDWLRAFLKKKYLRLPTEALEEAIVKASHPSGHHAGATQQEFSRDAHGRFRAEIPQSRRHGNIRAYSPHRMGHGQMGGQ
jgi:hypothetical protein